MLGMHRGKDNIIHTVRSIKKVTVTDKSYQLNRKPLTFSKNLHPKTVNFFEEALPAYHIRTYEYVYTSQHSRRA